MPGTACERGRGSAGRVERRAGREGREVSRVPCKKNRLKRMNERSGILNANTLLSATSTVDTYHLYIYIGTLYYRVL
jgi:hypothetical protein